MHYAGKERMEDCRERRKKAKKSGREVHIYPQKTSALICRREKKGEKKKGIVGGGERLVERELFFFGGSRSIHPRRPGRKGEKPLHLESASTKTPGQQEKEDSIKTRRKSYRSWSGGKGGN